MDKRETRSTEPADVGAIEIIEEIKHCSGKVHVTKAGFSWRFKTSTRSLSPGEELVCTVKFDWMSGKADPELPLHGTPSARIAFQPPDEDLGKAPDHFFPQLEVVAGPRKKHYANLSRTVKVLRGPGDSLQARVVCMIPSRESAEADRLALKILIGAKDNFCGVEAIYEWGDLSDPADAEAMTLDETNSMLPSQASPQPLSDLSSLERAGYRVYPIGSLKVLYANPAVRHSDSPLPSQPVGEGGFDVVANGTYTTDAAHLQSAGAIMRNGVLDTPGVEKASLRGGLAVLEDGTVVIGRAKGGTAKALQKRFGQPGNPVREFMGGAALLINGGKAVPGRELWEVEKFDQGGARKTQDGLDAQQMDKTYHSLVGIKDGQAYLVVPKDKSGREIQADLIRMGFGSALKLDGRSGCFLKDSRDRKVKLIYKGRNSVGLGIHCRK